MGNRSDISRAMRLRLAVLMSVMLCAGSSTACIDLAEPDVPSLNASAVFNLTVRQIPGQPIDIGGTLTSGRDSIGVPRRVLSPLIVLGAEVPLGEANAQRIYVISKQIPVPADPTLPPGSATSFVGPFEIQPPLIENTAQPPVFRWYGLRRLDADTVRTDASGDVALHVQSRFGAVTPAPSSQWFLELRGSAGSIHVSGDGPPPDTLRIPSQFLPAGASKRVDATLIYFQSATIVAQPVPYISSVTLDVRTQWVILRP